MGFCPLNDVVIALRSLQKRGKVGRAIVIDVDIHKGDGAAQITRGDDSIFAFSIHGSQTWPLEGGHYPESLLAGDLDVALRRTEDYLPALREALGSLPQDFDLALVVQGADPFKGDELPGSAQLNLGEEQMLDRDKMVHLWLSSLGIPQAYCMGGGYGRATWKIYYQYLSWALQLA